MGKLKQILRNFLEHYESLNSSHRSKLQCIEQSKETGRHSPPPLSLYEQEYLKLKELTEMLKTDPNYPMAEGVSDVNKKKNRYKDILPYDNSRVILSEYPGVPGSDYINANYVRGSSGNQRAYIASQGPLPNTLVDYWRMIWETEVLVIVMACNEREAGKYKCESYWPINTEETQQYGNISVEHVKWRQVCPDFLVRTFRVTCDNEERTICQFHYTTWPDHGVPASVTPILELVRLMRDVQSTESRPILVHCSAGCGRTGTLCSIDYVWALLRTGKLREDFSLFEIICDMRRQRTSMVQTLEQYILCYKAVATLFEQHLKLIDAHTYENIDLNGDPLGTKDHSDSEEKEVVTERVEKLQNDIEKLDLTKITENQNISTEIKNDENGPTDSTEEMNEIQTKSEFDNSQNTRNSNDIEHESKNHSKQNDEEPNKESNNEPNDIHIEGDNRQTTPLPKINKSQTDIDIETTSLIDDDSQDDAIRTEKIVGKATVIRRPSIAKLKAIFDSPSASNIPNTFDVSRTPEAGESSKSQHSSSQAKLRRSQSIKDSVRNLNFNIQLEIQQSRSIKPAPLHGEQRKQSNKSFTLNSAKLSVYKQQHLSLDDIELEDNTTLEVNADIAGEADSGGETTGTSSRNESSQNSEPIRAQTPEGVGRDNALNHPPPKINAESPAEEYAAGNSHLLRPVPVKLSARELHSQPSFRRQDYFRQTFGPEELSSTGLPVPPKPPRTYQHVLDDSCILRTPEGRLFLPMQHPNSNSASGLIPLGMKASGNGQFDYGRKSKSIYDLSAHKYMSQTPTIMMSTPGEAMFGPQFQQQRPGQQYIHNEPKPYSMSVMASRTPLPFGAEHRFMAQHHNPHLDMTYDISTPVPMTPQHFQFHQAKPMQIHSQTQQTYFEPIYGTSGNNRQMSGFSIQQRLPPGAMQPIYHQLPPRPRSISHGQFKQVNYENIYSNREICFAQTQQQIAVNQQQMQQHQQQQQQVLQFSHQAGPVNSVGQHLTVAPLQFTPQRPPENIYAEINNLGLNQSSQNNGEGRVQKIQDLQQTPGGPGQHKTEMLNSSKQTSQSSSPSIENSKNRSFSKLKNVFKVFSRSTTKISPSESSGNKNFISKETNEKRSTIMNTSNLISGSKISNRDTNSSSGQINPLNGQPLSRPPHSHRFHQQSQWTQV